MVHRAPELGMRMKHNADRSVLLPSWMIPAFDAPSRAGKNDFGHEWRTSIGWPIRIGERNPATTR
jgi:hypothetical protein